MDSQWLLNGSGIFLGAAGWFQALFLLNIFIVLASIMSCVQECFFPHFCFAEDKYLRLPNAFCDFAVSDSSMFLSNVFIAYRKKKKAFVGSSSECGWSSPAPWGGAKARQQVLASSWWPLKAGEDGEESARSAPRKTRERTQASLEKWLFSWCS